MSSMVPSVVCMDIAFGYVSWESCAPKWEETASDQDGVFYLYQSTTYICAFLGDLPCRTEEQITNILCKDHSVEAFGVLTCNGKEREV